MNKRLHIITPLYRFDLLEKVYNSILINDDIIWHISKSKYREDLNYDFLKNDKRSKFLHKTLGRRRQTSRKAHAERQISFKRC